MDSIASRRNDSPFKTSNSYAISRRLDNSPRRQSSTIAGSSNSFRPGYSPQRTPYNSRQSLSRSYDSPEGIRVMSQNSAKKASSSLRRAASPPACSSSKSQHISAPGRNQTILDDAAWMSERIHSLQKTGFLRYPSVSKLHPGEISPSLHSPRASNKDDEVKSILSCSSPGCFNQSSTLRHSQTVMSQTDEPLSAFRLSEVTLSEEDLLTDISSSRDFSTCNSTPVLLQSSRSFDQRASEFYQGTPLSHNAGKDDQKYMQQSNVSPVNHLHSAASSGSTSSNMREDLLLRLEALQYRAELAASGIDSFSSNSNANQDNQNSTLLWSGQVSLWDQDTLSSNQKRSALTQQSNAASSASPTHSNLSIESISWPEQPESSLDSTCWLKAINEEAKAEPSASHLILTSSRSIRPEYYLPLSREEEPAFEYGASLFSSPKGGKRTELRNDNIRRLALGVCQQRSEQMRPGKSVNNHRQTALAGKSKRFLESSMDSVNRYGSVKARGMTTTSSPKPSTSVARRSLPTEARASQNHLCIEYKDIAHPKHEQSKSIHQSFEMKALALEMDGQTRNSLENRFEDDSESSWISEENVEGFLRSRSFALDEASTSNDWSTPVLDTNLIHSTSKTAPSISSERLSRNKSIEDSQTKDSGKGLFSSSHTQSACLNEEAVRSSTERLDGICMFNRCKELPLPSQGGTTMTRKTDTHLQLLKGGPLADSHQAASISHQSVCQISHSGDESLNNDLIACSKDTLNNDRLSMASQQVKEQISRKWDSSSWSAVSPKDSSRVVEESLENNMTLQAEKKLDSTYIGQCHSARYSFNSSIPLVSESGPLSLDALSSPAGLVEDRYWPVIASRNENATHISKMHSQNLLEGRSSEPKVFARIVRSLSFSEQGNSKQTNRDIRESKSTGFTHYWIPNSAYSLNSFDLEYNGEKCSRKTPEEGLNSRNSVEMLQTTSQITKEMLQEMPSQNGRGDIDRGPEGSDASLILLDNPCSTDLNIDQLAEEPYGMAHTVLLSHTTKSESGAILDGDCKAPLSSKNFLQECHDLQLDRPIETHCKVQDNSRIESVQEDIHSLQQVISRVSKGKETEVECHRQSSENFTVGESLCTKTLLIEPEETEPEVIFEKLTVSEQHIGIPSFANQNNRLMREGVDKGDMVLKFPCTPGPENGRRDETPCGRGEAPSSLLSIYKNPLWRDEVNVDFDDSQNLEFLDHSYPDEGNFLDSDKNRIGFSKRSLGEVWDTYEGMGGFISFPNSSSCTTKPASEANHILVGLDSLINSSESNSFVLDSVWDAEGSAKKLTNIGEEVHEVPGFFAQQRLSCNSQPDQHQQSAQSLETIELQTIHHDTSPSSVKDITSTVDGNINNTTSISLPLAHIGGFEDCLRERSVRPYGSSSRSTKLIISNATNQDAALVANERTINDSFLNSQSECSTGKEMMTLTEVACKADEAGREALDKLDHNGSKTRRELTAQNSGASINIASISASQCADRKLQSNPLCEQSNKECVPPRHLKLGLARADAPEEDSVIHSNDPTEAGEEVKQVTFIYSDSKEPQKDLQAVDASLPQVPLDLLSTWILSFFTHASKGGGSSKRKEQKPLIQDKKREDEVELKRIGKKVQALEAEIDRFKQENRKLQSLVKCMIRKVKQLQQGLQGRKRNGTSRGFMTCIHVKRSRKSKILRKS